MARSSATSALRQMFDEGVSLSPLFNVVRGRAESLNSDKLGSGQSNADSNVGQAQVSAVGLRPISLEEKLAQLIRMVKNGKALHFPNGVSMDAIRHELKKPEHDGLGVLQMMDVLTKKKMLKPIQTPAAVYKLQTLAPRMM